MNHISELQPILPGGPAQTIDARWVGCAQVTDRFDDTVKIHYGSDYQHARILVRDGTRVLGYVEVGVEDSIVLGQELNREMRRLQPLATIDDTASTRTASELPPVSVVICTRDRTSHLKRVLESVLALDYPSFEVIVVDNAATTLETWRYVEGNNDERLRVVNAAVPGLSAARNRGLESASHEIVAFTDDDVIVDSAWLRCLTRPFADPEVATVTGLVTPASLRTPAQVAFQDRVSWGTAPSRGYFNWRDRHSHGPLFPFRVADFGTGANFAVRRRVAFSLGGFDEALGAGTPTAGAEDIDWFVRSILADHTLAIEPDAITWHEHRATEAELMSQAHGYGLGLGAWLAKVATDRRLAPHAVSRSVLAAKHLAAGVLSTRGALTSLKDPETGRLREAAAKAEAAGLRSGPRALARARAAGRRASPLK